MATNLWVVHTMTGEFKFGGRYEPTSPDANHSVIIVPGDTMPDPRTQKWGGSSVVAKTVVETADYDAVRLSEHSLATSRQKDILTTCALVVRARGIPAWNAMTNPQKVTAVLAEADVWRGLREFIDDRV